MELIKGAKSSEDRLYVVWPPGSGKTVTGLMLAVEMNVPTLVLVPNTAIQSQWIAKTSMFVPPDSGIILASHDPARRLPVTVMTYQSLARPPELDDSERATLLAAWTDELVEEWGTREEAVAWLADLEKNNPEQFRFSLLRRRKKSRNDVSAVTPGSLDAVALATMELLRDAKIGLVVFDECHHLTGFWAEMAVTLLEKLGSPKVLGLTATPPGDSELSDYELALHKTLLRNIDFKLLTPAVVREGFLAPYQDLVYFTRPGTGELEFVRNCSDSLVRVLAMTENHDETTLSDWLSGELNNITVETFASVLRKRRDFIENAASYLSACGKEMPERFRPFAGKKLRLEDRADLVGRYAAKFLLARSEEKLRCLHGELAAAFRPLGYVLTEKGLRHCQSTVDRVLSLSQAKLDAMADILKHEMQGAGDLRVLVVTDFERSSATVEKSVASLINSESGGAVAAMRKLTSDPETDKLDPILVTGKTVLVDDDLLQNFLVHAEKWIAANNLAVNIETVSDAGFFEIRGSGADWTPRNYVAMVTSMFELGVTRCLVGTRGLLGEGWDSLRANTLIDLTSASTSVAVNQLRGRVIRKDPLCPGKVANIWDVVCMAPEFENGLNDYARFARKHAGYYGLCDDGEIEFGLGHIHSALTDAGPEDVALNAHLFNSEMLIRCLARQSVMEKWKIGSPYEDKSVDAVEVKADASFRSRSVRGRIGRMRGFELDAGSKLTGICLALLDALKATGKIGKGPCSIRVTERADDYFRLFLDGANEEDVKLFSTSLAELFMPIEGQKYMIPRYEQILADNWLSDLLPEVFRKYVARKVNRIAVYHPLPRALSGSRAEADIFSECWNYHVSPGVAVYVFQGRGEQMLAEARSSGQTISEARAKLKSLWR